MIHGSLIFDLILSIIISDSLLAIGAVLAVFSFLWLQTGSCFVAAMGMLEILFSLPCAYALYRHVFQLKYFDGLNAMCLFIVLAIGADDIFVFFDAYKQARLHRNAHCNTHCENSDKERRFPLPE